MPVFSPVRPGPPSKRPLIPNFAEFAAQNPWVGTPIGGPQDVPGGGYVQQFENATAYALFGGVPYEVHGAIRDKYNQLGGPTGFLGFPTSSETGCPDGVGRFSNFTGGSIYYHPSVGAFQIGGLIEEEWNALGATQYGYPSSDETGCVDGIGRYNRITTLLPNSPTAQASIYWTPGTGAHEIRGAIHAAWAQLGFETSYLGYPVSDEHDDSGGRRSDFQNGSIFWTAANGITLLPQAFTVDAPNVTFGSGIAAGGNARFQIFSDGTTHFTGHLHDSGFSSYDCLAVFSVKDEQNRAYTASQTGTIHGTDAPGSSRDLDWNIWGSSDDVRRNWASIRSSGVGGGTVSVTSDWSAQKISEEVSSIFGTILSVLDVISMIFGGGSSQSPSGDSTDYDPDANLPGGYSDQDPGVDTGQSE